MTAYEDLFELPASDVDLEVLRRFIETAEAANALAESTVVELKLKPNGKNVVEAVAAFCNTDGGVALVGLDETARGEERIVGVTTKDRDALVAQLHSLIPEAMPELVVIAVPDTNDRCVLVLRVNADAVRHPVVVSGKVLIRIPGHTMPADRDTIIALARRDEATGAARGRHPSSAFSPGSCELWNSRELLLELRTWGSVRLPARVLDHAWFGTREKERATETLSQGPLPDLLWSASPTKVRQHPWVMTDARSNWFHLESESRPDLVAPNPILTAAHVELAGQDLTGLVAVGLIAHDEQSPADLKERPLALSLLNEALVTSVSVHASLCRALANELEAEEPVSWFPITAQMTAGKAGNYGFLDDVLDLDHWQRDTTNRLQSHTFPRATSPRDDVKAGLALTREWLNLLLLDVGARAFEAELSTLRAPNYLSR